MPNMYVTFVKENVLLLQNWNPTKEFTQARSHILVVFAPKNFLKKATLKDMKKFMSPKDTRSRITNQK